MTEITACLYDSSSEETNRHSSTVQDSDSLFIRRPSQQERESDVCLVPTLSEILTVVHGAPCDNLEVSDSHLWRDRLQIAPAADTGIA